MRGFRVQTKTTTIMKALDFFYDLFIVNVTTGKEVRAQTVYGKEPALTLAKDFNEENAGHPVKAIVKINPSHK